MKKAYFQKQIPWFLTFLFVVSLGLYFRTYPLRQQGVPRPEKMAALLVERTLTQRFKNLLDLQTPALSGDDKLKLAREQAQRMIQSDPVNYQKTVAQTLAEIKTSLPRSSGRRYLLEADPYYYFYLTEQIIRHGKIAEKIKGGEYYHPLMHAPYGYWTAVTWHPYVGYEIGRLIRLFSPQIEWMEALGWVPLVLSVLACLSFLFFAKALEMEVFSFLIGALALMLSPIFIQRSGFGWYDTDPYNYIFPFLILAVTIAGLKNQKRTVGCAAVSGFLTGLYGLFWTGWPFLFLLLPTALIAADSLVRYVWKRGGGASSTFRRYAIVQIISSVGFAALFLTPEGLLKSVQLGFEILRKFSLSDTDVWPNIFLTVGEARGASLKKLIYLSGNYITFAIAMLGLVHTGWRAWREKKAESLMQWMFLFLFSIPLFILPLKTERFGILFVIPLSFWCMYGARAVREGLTAFTDRIPLLSNFKGSMKAFCAAVIILVFLPLPLITAHLVSFGIKPIMDDAWFETMQELREKTPENAIVDSWWPPGYFISALAHRRVIADGGTQHLRESYWMAQILAAQDEKEAAGLLRMLNQNGNDALLFLKKLGLETSDSVNLILSVSALSRDAALRALPPEMPEQIKNQFLDLTHGRGSMPATYVMVYSDLVEQNLAVTMIARWNFKKAREMKRRAFFAGFGRSDASSYAQDFINTTDGILKYTPEAGLQKREGDVLFFSNGLIVNLSLMDAVVNWPEKHVQGRPASFFFMKDGKLEEKVLEGERIDASALLIHDADGSYRAVLADPRLIRSLLFRLYYLHGEGLSYFKPFSTHQDPLTGNRVSVFELKREAFHETDSTPITV